MTNRKPINHTTPTVGTALVLAALEDTGAYDTNSGSYAPTNRRPGRSHVDLDDMQEFISQSLFGGRLPPCLITLQRSRNSYGYFANDRFINTSNPSEVVHEIALNPMQFATRRPIDVVATLTHECVHLWQSHFGKPGRGGYHNEEWAAVMERIGLMPSSTGAPGGKRTGERMDHYILPGGLFEQVCSAYLSDKPITLFQDIVGLVFRGASVEGGKNGVAADLQERLEKADRERARKAASKTKFFCPRCKITTAWAVATAKFLCGGEKCDQEAMVPTTKRAKATDLTSEDVEEEAR